MKKIYSLAIAASVAIGLNAQTIPSASQGEIPDSYIKKSHSTVKAFNQLYIDYDFAEDQNYGGTNQYQRFIWRMNTTDSTSRINAVVAFDSIYDAGTFTTYVPGVDYTTIRIDSIFAVIGHENNSGIDDTIRFKVIALNGSGYPQPTNVLYSKEIYTNVSLSSSGNYLTSALISDAPGLSMASTQRFGILMEYDGAKVDTFGLLAGFHHAGSPSGNCSYVAYASDFFGNRSNSYGATHQFASYGLLPTSTGADIYYDCDQSGSFNAGDSRSYTQNWNIWLHVTLDPNVGINELAKESRVSAFPNPSKDVVTFKFSNVEPNTVLNLIDVSGKVVRTEVVNGSSHLMNISELVAGTYYYTLIGENTISNTGKLIISK
mgnify:CR=1 FL=1